MFSPEPRTPIDIIRYLFRCTININTVLDGFARHGESRVRFNESGIHLSTARVYSVHTGRGVVFANANASRRLARNIRYRSRYSSALVLSLVRRAGVVLFRYRREVTFQLPELVTRASSALSVYSLEYLPYRETCLTFAPPNPSRIARIRLDQI